MTITLTQQEWNGVHANYQRQLNQLAVELAKAILGEASYKTTEEVKGAAERAKKVLERYKIPVAPSAFDQVGGNENVKRET